MPRKRLDDAQLRALFLRQCARTGDPWLAAKYLYEAGLSGVPETCEPVRNVSPVAQCSEAHREARPVLMAIATRYEISIELLIETDGSAIAEAIWCLRESGMDFESIRVATHRRDYFDVVDACVRAQRVMEIWPEMRAALSTIARLPEQAQRRLEATQ